MRGLRVILALGLLSACNSGVGVEGPIVKAADAPGVCPSTSDALARTRESIRDGALAELTPIAKEILIDDGGLRVLIPGVRTLAREVPVDSLFGVTEGYTAGEGLARLRPHAINVFDYFAGSSAFIPGEHYEPLDATHRMLSRCDIADTLGLVRALLELEVTLPDGTRGDWFAAVFDVLVLLASDQAFQVLVTSIEFTDEENPDEITLGREAFKLIARLLTENLANPDFEIDALRPLLDDVLETQLQGDGSAVTRAHIDSLLDLLELGFNAEPALFIRTQTFIGCLNDEDPDRAIPGMLFDYLSVDELSLPELLSDFDALGDDAAGQVLVELLISGSRALEASPNLTRDMLTVLARFIDPEVSRTSAPATLGLQGTGVVGEILGFLELITSGTCGGAP